MIAIIQARMGSKRLPGKSLINILGKPSLLHLIESLRQSRNITSIVVATSMLPQDDPIAGFCGANSIDVFRGSETNVASRFRDILVDSDVSRFMRFCGDSPLFDYRIVDSVVDKTLDLEVDLSTTISSTRPFPSGMNVEILCRETFLSAYPNFYSDAHFEHVTKYFYENCSRYKICVLEPDFDCRMPIKFSIDTKFDYDRVVKFFCQLDKNHYHYSLQEKCQMMARIS